MSTYVEGCTRTFQAGAALAPDVRVKLSSGKLALAGVNDAELGVTADRAYADLDYVAVRLRTSEGTFRAIASAAIAVDGLVYAGASGKVSPTGSLLIGKALTAASADGDVIEVLRVESISCSQSIVAAASEGSTNSIAVGATGVEVTAVTVDANDFIVLPAIAAVPIGYTIRISANAGSNFEMRTPASSNTKINDVDSDGTQEYLVTDTHLVVVTKRTSTGWAAQSLTKLGAVVTAVVPD